MIVIDVETVPGHRSIIDQFRSADVFKPDRRWKKDTSDAKEAEWKEDQDKRLETMWEETALDPNIGRICYIGIATCSDGKSLELLPGSVLSDDVSEAQILSQFHQQLRTAYETVGIPIVGHNIVDFDAPFLWKRAVINRVRPLVQLNARRYSTDQIFDTMQVWCGWSAKERISLRRLCETIGVSTPEGFGSEIFRLWSEGKAAEIISHCNSDLVATSRCWARMNFLEINGPIIYQTSNIAEL